MQTDNPKEVREPLNIKTSNCLKHIITKKKGDKPNKTPSLKEPSPAITTHLKMEATYNLYKAIDTLYL